MLKLRTLRFALLTAALAIIVNLALSDAAFAKQKRGRFNDKKAGKFINGHDARDGRWDGRGPRSRFHDRRGRFDDRRDRFDDRRGRFDDRRDRFDDRRGRFDDRRDRFDDRRGRRRY